MSINNKFVIVEHARASCFLIADGVRPAGKGRGYVLRRLMRRLLSSALKLGIDINNKDFYTELVESTISSYKNVYNELYEAKTEIIEFLYQESQKYNKAIAVGQKEWAKILV